MTPTQSVVVPVEPTEAMLVAADNAGGRFAGSDLSEHDMHQAIWSAMLAADPAPSSLAGGEVRTRLIETLKRVDDGVYASLNEQADAILAALSPEAPVREVHRAVTGDDLHAIMIGIEDRSDVSEIADLINLCTALTPRHEAPAEGAGEDVNWKAEYESVCEARISDRAASQEIINERDKWIVELIQERDALRARSSAPEASAEGEPVAWQRRAPSNLYWTLFDNPKDAEFYLNCDAGERYTVHPLYTHPAAPSADKLREVSDLLENLAGADDVGDNLYVSFNGVMLPWREAVNEAILVLSTPDALKGDAK